MNISCSKTLQNIVFPKTKYHGLTVHWWSINVSMGVAALCIKPDQKSCNYREPKESPCVLPRSLSNRDAAQMKSVTFHSFCLNSSYLVVALSSLQVLLQALQSRAFLALYNTEHNVVLIDEHISNGECWQISAVCVTAPRVYYIYVKQRFVFPWTQCLFIHA